MIKNVPFWWDETKTELQAAFDFPKEVDVAIVGGGLTGLSAARTFAKAGISVAVLEAGKIGQGASSRNGGMLGGGHRLSFADLSRMHGADVAKGLISEAHLNSTEFTQQLIKDQRIDCDFKRCGRFRGFVNPKEYEGQKRALGDLQELINIDAKMIPKSDVQSEIKSERFHGGLVFASHGGLNPARFTQGLAQAAQSEGAMLIEDCRVKAIERISTGFQLETTNGKFSVGKVLMATNGYTPKWAVHQARSIIPVPSFLIATEELGEDFVRRLFPTMRMCVETGTRHTYFRPSPCGKRVILGGRAGLVNVPEKFAQNTLKKLLTTIFPDLSGVGLTHSWRGNIGFTFDSMPNIGSEEGVWHAMGYSGNGNSMAPYLGHKAALLMMDDREGETAFTKTGFPKRWFYHQRSWFMPAVDIWWRGKDLRSKFN